MDVKRKLLRHFLATLAYRTQKAVRSAPSDFGSFQTSPKTRTPAEIIRHMDGVLGYAGTIFTGEKHQPPSLPDFKKAIEHFHETLAEVAKHLELGTELRDITPEMLLQGPLSDAMTHAGQLAILRRLADKHVPPENFVYANIDAGNLSANQPLPARPDKQWPENPDSAE